MRRWSERGCVVTFSAPAQRFSARVPVDIFRFGCGGLWWACRKMLHSILVCCPLDARGTPSPVVTPKSVSWGTHLWLRISGRWGKDRRGLYVFRGSVDLQYEIFMEFKSGKALREIPWAGP